MRDATIATITVSLAATAITIAVALVASYGARVWTGNVGAIVARVSAGGYAVPGTVLAIGVLPIVSAADRGLDAAMHAALDVRSPVFLLATIAALLYAYPARFLAVGSGVIDAGFSRISRTLDDAAQSLGDGQWRRLWRIHLPILRPALAAAAMLVFVDTAKELPATLLLRPVGMETLATHLYGEAARGTYEDGAIAALLIVACGLAPVIILARAGDRWLSHR